MEAQRCDRGGWVRTGWQVVDNGGGRRRSRAWMAEEGAEKKKIAHFQLSGSGPNRPGDEGMEATLVQVQAPLQRG